ncbi:hypothetical protein BASA61_004487 [Batrachochytrium salamandrivorans]|nr:hypothetical protein BASA61_004487 [Batrachochytrium salamandrivorans]
MVDSMARPRATTPSPKTTRGKTTPSLAMAYLIPNLIANRKPSTTVNVAAAAVNLFYLSTLCMISHTSRASSLNSSGNFHTSLSSTGGTTLAVSGHKGAQGLELKMA